MLFKVDGVDASPLLFAKYGGVTFCEKPLKTCKPVASLSLRR